MTAKDFFLSWGMVLAGVVMNVAGIYIVKLKINNIGAIQFDSMRVVVEYFLTLAKSPLAIIGGILIMAAPFPYAIALSRMQLSMAYPLSIALNCAIILPLSIIFLGESVTVNKLTAIGMVLISLYFLYK